MWEELGSLLPEQRQTNSLRSSVVIVTARPCHYSPLIYGHINHTVKGAHAVEPPPTPPIPPNQQ